MRLPFVVPLCLAGIALVGCSSSANAPHVPAQPTPPVFTEHVVVMLQDGQPMEEVAYQKMLARCHADGTPTQALTIDQQAYLGRRMIQTWQAPNRFAQHISEWHQDTPGNCQFGLRKLETVIVHAQDNQVYRLDLTSGKGSAVAGRPIAPHVAQTDQDIALSSTAHDNGWADPATVSVDGQPGLVWQSPTGEQVCVWKGGMAYGYSAGTDGILGSDGTPTPLGGIVLWSKPAKGNGWQVTASRVVVGQPIPPSVFEKPAGATVVP